ncbi:MAG TPA: TetR/AcrR family transcriptional regulator [Actinomycetospora sp.]|jgi:AcrR family transcriptional regulator|uniref:TetR/AcrR family transcriptional regulator n=1 Tax=Actinomycetospora sp. TaxID=1872135 RepID=UPI002F3FB452
MKTTRTYTMGARAEAAEATRLAILDALVGLAGERMFSDIGLDDVATRAGVSVQTVLRRFTTRANLLEEGYQYAREQVFEERRAPVGDVPGAMQVLAEHYERRGRASVLFLAQEDREPLAARITTEGRALHRAWVEEVFGPFLPGPPGERAEVVDLLVVACDVYTWKLLRLDRALSRDRTTRRMERLVRTILAGPGTRSEGKPDG